MAFAAWTGMVRIFDVEAIGPSGSMVGFATMNRFVHNLTGVNMLLYAVTDWLGLIPIGIIIGFAVLGLFQWITRKTLRKVDTALFKLGVFYLVVMAVYVFFEKVVINYRPVLICGVLEASYPSSTTMLAMCVMPTFLMQMNSRIKNRTAKSCITVWTIAFTCFMVLGRFFSGVHWLSDIIGGILCSTGLVMLLNASE